VTFPPVEALDGLRQRRRAKANISVGLVATPSEWALIVRGPESGLSAQLGTSPQSSSARSCMARSSRRTASRPVDGASLHRGRSSVRQGLQVLDELLLALFREGSAPAHSTAHGRLFSSSSLASSHASATLHSMYSISAAQRGFESPTDSAGAL